MEFTFSLANLFDCGIGVVDSALKPSSNTGSALASKGHMRQVIDEMGRASCKAQGLHAPITSGRKLECSNHRLYTITDMECHNNLGAAVGILKVGTKKLFVYDHHGNQHEMDPLCVLDFYVHESRQRSGCGKKLFEYMLKEEAIEARHLAIDRPSMKLSHFLSKHYDLKSVIPQVNNFVIYEGFFRGRPETDKRMTITGRGRPPRPPSHKIVPAGVRSVASADVSNKIERGGSGRQSSLSGSNVPVSQLEKENTLLQDIPLPRSNSRENMSGSIQRMDSSQRSNSLALDLDGLAMSSHSQTRALGAQASMYSRHGVQTTTGVENESANRVGMYGNKSSATRQQTQHHTREKSPPPAPRGMVPAPSQYLGVGGALNSHRNYQGHRGHLKVMPSTSTATLDNPSPLAMSGNTNPQIIVHPIVHPPAYSQSSNIPSNRNTIGARHGSTPGSNEEMWSAMGLPATYSSQSAKKYSHTRLW